MGLFKRIRGVFKGGGGILKGGVSIDKVFTTVASGIDELHLSEEEKAAGVRDFVKDTLSENTARSKARRFIAKVLISNSVLLVWFTIICYFVNPESVQVVLEIVKAYKLDVAFLAIIGFFFGGYYLSKLRGKKKDDKNTT